MKLTRASIVAFALALGLMTLAVPAMRAQQVTGGNPPALTLNEATRFEFKQPVEVPGMVLPAGSYYFIVADTADGHTIQIFDNAKRLVTTLQTISTERFDTTETTLVTLAAGSNGRPDAIVKWYYPNFRIGHEFVYSPAERKAHEEQPVKTMVARETTKGSN
jgi:hypothetical protein